MLSFLLGTVIVSVGAWVGAVTVVGTVDYGVVGEDGSVVDDDSIDEDDDNDSVVVDEDSDSVVVEDDTDSVVVEDDTDSVVAPSPVTVTLIFSYFMGFSKCGYFSSERTISKEYTWVFDALHPVQISSKDFSSISASRIVSMYS